MWLRFHPRYEVSVEGQIRNIDNYILKPSKSGVGYLQVEIDGKSKNIHRIVADMFCPRECHEKLQVDHIDRNRQNNHASNLRWVSISENHRNRTPSTIGRIDSTTGHACIYLKIDGRPKPYWCKIVRHNLKHSSHHATLEEAIFCRDTILSA
jgi:NADH:ubiquinone oxidoreductase subunit D